MLYMYDSMINTNGFWKFKHFKLFLTDLLGRLNIFLYIFFRLSVRIEHIFHIWNVARCLVFCLHIFSNTENNPWDIGGSLLTDFLWNSYLRYSASFLIEFDEVEQDKWKLDKRICNDSVEILFRFVKSTFFSYANSHNDNEPDMAWYYGFCFWNNKKNFQVEKTKLNNFFYRCFLFSSLRAILISSTQQKHLSSRLDMKLVRRFAKRPVLTEFRKVIFIEKKRLFLFCSFFISLLDFSVPSVKTTKNNIKNSIWNLETFASIRRFDFRFLPELNRAPLGVLWWINSLAPESWKSLEEENKKVYT